VRVWTEFMAGSCEHSNESSVKSGKFHDQFSDCEFQKEHCSV